jgi:hypothetical protein
MGEVSRLRRVPPVLAVVLGLLALGAVLADLVGSTVLHQAAPGGAVVNWLITLAVTLPCTAVGVLLAARRPANPIGWLLLLTADPATSTPFWTTGSTTERCHWAGWRCCSSARPWSTC